MDSRDHQSAGAARIGGSPPGRPPSSTVALRSDRLVLCATELFLEKGFHKVSLQLLAREAHVAVRTIYAKFGSKAGLFEEVVRVHCAGYYNEVPALDPHAQDIAEALVDFSLRYVRLVTAQRSLAIHRMVIAEMHDCAEAAEAFIRAGPDRMSATLAAFFSHPAVSCRLRSDFGPARLAQHFADCLMGGHIRRLLCKDGATDDEPTAQHVRAALALFEHGVRRQEGSSASRC